MKNLQDEIYRIKNPPTSDIIYGRVGAIINGEQSIDVRGRGGFIYVRLRGNPSEFVQAWNEKIQNLLYDVPIKLRREGNRYVVLERDSQQYSQWVTQDTGITTGTGITVPQIVTPRHGSTHSFDYTNKLGGFDVSWIYSRQFLPLLVSPYNDTSENLYIVGQTLQDINGEWKYLGNTGTTNIVNLKPTSGAKLVLVSIDSESGLPELTEGGYMPPNLTGTHSVIPYAPYPPSLNHIPLAFVRLETGTKYLDWDNLYDARPFISSPATNTAVTVNDDYPINELVFSGSGVEFTSTGTVGFIYDNRDENLFRVTEELTYLITGSNTYFPTTLPIMGLVEVTCNVRQEKSSFTVTGSGIGLNFIPTQYDHLIVDYPTNLDYILVDDNGSLLVDDNQDYVTTL